MNYDDEDFPHDFNEDKYSVEIVTDACGIRRRVFVLKEIDEDYLYDCWREGDE
jgi:hypothetical protein